MVRLNELFTKINKERNKIRTGDNKDKEIGSSTTFDLNVYNYIICGTPIKYSLRIPYDNKLSIVGSAKGGQLERLIKGLDTASKATKSIFRG